MKIWTRIHTASGISKRSHNGRTQIVASGRRYLNHNLVLILTLLLLLVTLCTPVKANDDDMLRELLEEQSRLEEERMQEDSHQYDDEHIAQQQQERLNQEKLRQDDAIAAQERVLEQERQRIRQQREAAFEANLARMNEDQRKLAQKQKKKDAKVVKKILKAFAKQNYYAVLGLHNLDFTIGPIRFLSYQFGPFTFFRPDAKDIKKAYRGRAMITHPDKNRDGQAHEAFVAVEESAAVLADERMRAEYDVFRKQMRLEQQARTMDVIKKVLLVVHQQVSRIIWIFRNLMGPFATPILILGCLII